MVFVGFAFYRTVVDAGATAGAVFDGNLQGELSITHVLATCRAGFEGLRRAGKILIVIDLHADRSVRADERTDAALDAEVFVPDRSFYGDVAFFIHGGTGREGPVNRHCRNRQAVTEAVDDRAEGVLDGVRSAVPLADRHFDCAVGAGRNSDFLNVLQGDIDGLVVHVEDFFASLAVGFDDGILDLPYGLLLRDDVGDLEESGLHDDVDAGTETDLVAELDAIDNEELKLFVDDCLLNLLR